MKMIIDQVLRGITEVEKSSLDGSQTKRRK